jgi:uncharacterized protein YdaU (DUF1376 family)
LSGSYPWYTTDWRTCQDVLNMTAEQRDVYRNLLDMAWEWGDLPINVDQLQSLSLASPAEFNRSWPVVSRMFVQIDGRLHNRKVDERRPFVLQQKEARRNKAVDAARKRWDEERAKHATGNAPSIELVNAPSNARPPSSILRPPSSDHRPPLFTPAASGDSSTRAGGAEKLAAAKQMLDRYREKDSGLAWVARMVAIARNDLSLLRAFLDTNPPFVQQDPMLAHFRTFVRSELYRRKRAEAGAKP